MLIWNSVGCSKRQESTVEATLHCAQLYEFKKQQYWGDSVGNNKYIFNTSLNTCLALNIYNDSQAGRYFAMVIDMTDDETLLYYSDDLKGAIVDGDTVTKCENRAVHLSYTTNGREIKEAGCDRFDLWDKMFEQVKSFGFPL